MKTATTLVCLATLLLVSTFNALGQTPTHYQFSIHGTCWSTNSSGRFVSRIVSNRTLIQDYLQTAGLTNNPSSLSLSYHVNADSRGDTIEIVDTKTGHMLYPLLSFFFGTAFDRKSLDSADGLTKMRIDYVYSHQLNHSVGSTLTKIVTTPGRNGKPDRTLINGQFDYIVVPDAHHPVMQLCNGNFMTGKAMTVQN